MTIPPTLLVRCQRWSDEFRLQEIGRTKRLENLIISPFDPMHKAIRLLRNCQQENKAVRYKEFHLDRWCWPQQSLKKFPDLLRRRRLSNFYGRHTKTEKCFVFNRTCRLVKRREKKGKENRKRKKVSCVYQSPQEKKKKTLKQFIPCRMCLLSFLKGLHFVVE